jgi:PKD repeat protein
MMFGPVGQGQALYYTTYANNGQVRRIEFVQQPNQAPTAVVTPIAASGPAPLTVNFDASGSSDPDPGDTLTYVWDFGEGAGPTETTIATATHVYSTPGTFTATLAVRDNHGATSEPATIQIQVVGPPLIAPQNLAVPTVSGMLRVGNILTAGTGIWMGSKPLEFSYQWLRCDAKGNSCGPISAATEATYTLAPVDFGSTIDVVVTATNAAGSADATSEPTERVKHECSGSPCTSQLADVRITRTAWSWLRDVLSEAVAVAASLDLGG